MAIHPITRPFVPDMASQIPGAFKRIEEAARSAQENLNRIGDHSLLRDDPSRIMRGAAQEWNDAVSREVERIGRSGRIAMRAVTAYERRHEDAMRRARKVRA